MPLGYQSKLVGLIGPWHLGIIGPGLLVGSGNAFSEGGPAGVLISFSLVGIIVYFVM